MPLTAEMKKEVVNYMLQSGSFCKGLIEDGGILGEAYEDGTIVADDFYDFIDWMRGVVMQKLDEEAHEQDHRRLGWDEHQPDVRVGDSTPG